MKQFLNPCDFVQGQGHLVLKRIYNGQLYQLFCDFSLINQKVTLIFTGVTFYNS